MTEEIVLTDQDYEDSETNLSQTLQNKPTFFSQLWRSITNVIRFHDPRLPEYRKDDPKSRQEWIMYVVNLSGRVAQKEIEDQVSDKVSRFIVITDIKKLEQDGLIEKKLERYKRTQRAYLYPSKKIQEFKSKLTKTELFFDKLLPYIAVSLFVILVVISL